MSNYLYGSTKAAINAFLSGYRADLRAHNIHVLTVLCGLIRTKLIATRKVNTSLSSGTDKAALTIFKSFKRKRCVVYVPSWRYLIMLAVRLLPEWIFMRIKT